jgi:uncharacterized protein YbjT (DUF2867 family)
VFGATGTVGQGVVRESLLAPEMKKAFREIARMPEPV